MKKILLLMVVLFVVTSAGFASSNAKTVDSPTGIPQVKSICIDLGDITNLTESDLTKSISELLDASLSPLPAALQCAVTVKAIFRVAFAEFEISVTVSGDCSEIRASGKAIALQIVNEVKSYFERNFQ